MIIINSNRRIIHCDANSAYLSWTAAHMIFNGSKIDLREIPSVIGGSEKSRHGIVLAKSIPAKKYGINTGMPLVEVRELCPSVTIVPPNYHLYMKCSNAMMDILREYGPIQVFSIDEAFVDLTGSEQLLGDPLTVAYEINERIHNELGFTVNVGLGVNKLSAKMGGELRKPNVVDSLWPHEIEEKLWPLPVGELFMVGRSTEKKLKGLGINTIGQLANANPKVLYQHLKSHGTLVYNYANGIDYSPIRKSNHEVMKSIGNGTTSRFDVSTIHDASLIIMSLTESVAMRLRTAAFMARLVTISITYTDFRSITHQRKLPYSIDSTNEIFEIALDLFKESWTGKEVRKFGVRVGALHSNDFHQLYLYDNIDSRIKNKKVDDAIDTIRNKYGSKSVHRASFLHSGISSMSGGVNADDYPLMTSIL